MWYWRRPRTGSRLFPLLLATVCLTAVETLGQAPDIGFRRLGPARPANAPVLATAGPIVVQDTLEDAWRAALQWDQRVEAGQWNVSSAKSAQGAAEAERLPSLQLGANYYALSDQPAFSFNLSGTPLEMPFVDSTSGGFSAMVTQPLYTFGRISSGINAARESVNASQADLERTRLDIKMNVAEVYVLSLRARRLIEVAESRAASLEAHTTDVQHLFDKGLVSRNDLLAAQVALANARQQALQARNALRVVHAAYNRALGRPLSAPVRLAELPAVYLVGDVDELTRTALQCRPELAALSAQARGLREQAAAVQAQKAPQVGVTGGYLYERDQYIEPNGLAAVVLGLKWTPVDSGRVSHRAAALTEKAEAAVRLRKDTESMIALQVRQKWLDLQTALQRVEVTRQATAQADENIRVARDRYQHQVGTNTEVLEAETLRVQAYTNFYNSSYEAVLAELRLRRAVGNL